MEEAAGIQEWELLNTPGGWAAASDVFPGIESDYSEGAIKSDYFALGSEDRYGRAPPSDGDREGDSLPDSDNPSWVDPGSDSAFLGAPSKGDPGGSWTSDESEPSDGHQTPPPDRAEGGFQGQDGSDSGGIGGGDVVETGGEESGDVPEIRGGESGDPDVVETGGEESGDGPEIRGDESGDLRDPMVAAGGKAGWAWWKLPLALLKFCAFRIRPVWTISIAAALVGVVMLGRRLYKKKPKIKGFPLKVSVDDKVSQFMVRAARINEAFSVVKRVPMIRSTFPAAGVTPWPVVALR